MDVLRPVASDPTRVVAAIRAFLAQDPEPEPLVVETSGSTGTPKRVLLSRRALVASARATEAALGPARWVLALPPSYVAGLQVIVRSLLAGHDPTLREEHPSWADAVAGSTPVHTSLVPTQLHRMLDDPADRAALQRIDTVLLGGGPIDPALRARAEEAGVRVVATYGSSETCGGCVYDGRPLPGVDLHLDGHGRVEIGGPTLFDGYQHDPARTEEALVDGRFRTSDLGRLVDGRLQVLGRVDDVVISGGVNVPTPAVAARVREHPAVRAAEVVGVDDAEWGQRVVACVVGTVGLDELRDWVGATLPRSWAPRDLRAMTELPLLANGKVDRLRLRKAAAE